MHLDKHVNHRGAAKNVRGQECDSDGGGESWLYLRR